MKKWQIFLILSATSLFGVLSLLSLFSVPASQVFTSSDVVESRVNRLPYDMPTKPIMVDSNNFGFTFSNSEVSPQVTGSEDATGAITGTVIAAETGIPIAGAELKVYRVNLSGGEVVTTTTLSDGSFILAGLDTADYIVYVRADGYAAGWYPDTVECHLDASAIWVLADETTGVIDFKLQPGGSISGYIYLEDGVTPVPDAFVGNFSADETRNCNAIGIFSQSNGAYQITSAPPGPRRVAAYAPDYVAEYYQEKIHLSKADIVTVTTSTAVTDINFTLDHGGVITGHVNAEEGPTPLEGAYVSAVYVHPDSMRWQGGVQNTTTDANGVYQLPHVPFGGYYAVLAYYSGEPYSAWQFYQGSPDISRATLVTVTQTYTPTNIDFVLSSGGTITGHIYSADGVTPLPHEVTVAATNIYTSPLTAGGRSNLDGSYALGNVLPADEYLVKANYPGYVSKYYDNVTDRAAAIPVSVTTQTPAAGIDFQMEAYWPLDIGNQWVYRWHNSAVSTTITETIQLVASAEDRYTLTVSSPFAAGSAEVSWQSDGLRWQGWSISGHEGAPEWRSILEYSFMPHRFFYFKPAPGATTWTPFEANWVQQGEYFDPYQAHSTIAAESETVNVSGRSFENALRISTEINSSNPHLAGEREMWFVPGIGLVKLVYQHGDGQVTTAELVGLSEPTLVQSGTDSTLVFTDTLGGATIIEIPAGAVTETIILAYTPVESTTVPDGYTFAGRAFDLQAYQGGTLLPGYSFSLPVTITIQYNDQDVVGLDENTLILQHWDEKTESWEQAACGPYERHPDENWLTLPVCHLSRFALFGKGYSAYLPILFND